MDLFSDDFGQRVIITGSIFKFLFSRSESLLTRSEKLEFFIFFLGFYSTCGCWVQISTRTRSSVIIIFIITIHIKICIIKFSCFISRSVLWFYPTIFNYFVNDHTFLSISCSWGFRTHPPTCFRFVHWFSSWFSLIGSWACYKSTFCRIRSKLIIFMPTSSFISVVIESIHCIILAWTNFIFSNSRKDLLRNFIEF